MNEDETKAYAAADELLSEHARVFVSGTHQQVRAALAMMYLTGMTAGIRTTAAEADAAFQRLARDLRQVVA